MLFPSSEMFSIRKILQGAAAGFIATAPMSACMLIGWNLLPRREQYHLPPRMITQEITERVGLEDRMSETEMVGLTIVSHFGYGAAFGALYGWLEERLRLPAALKGAMAGLALWMGSYLGWLPAFRILSSAIRHPWRRNFLMIAAHLVWGVALGEVVRKLDTSRYR